MDKRLNLYAIAVLWAVLVSLGLCCGSCAQTQTPKPVQLHGWPAGSFPLELRLSEDLDACQVASVVAAAAWWESRAGMSMFSIVHAGRNDPALLGIPVDRVIGVVPADALLTPNTFGLAESWLDSSGNLASVTVSLRGCSAWVALHELSHALGLPHRNDTNAIMYPRSGMDGWGVSADELAIVMGR